MVAQYYAAARAAEDAADDTYQRANLEAGYWLMIDLDSSASYRQRAGESRAFVRAEVLMRLMRLVTEESGDTLLLFKELGDGALIRATSFRAALELLCLLDGIKELWAVDVGHAASRPSLTFHAAITKGDAMGFNGDYFGAPIDRVARIANITSGAPDLLCVIEDAARVGHDLNLRAELPCLVFDPPSLVPTAILKQDEQPFLVASVRIDREVFGNSTGYFRLIREAAPRVAELLSTSDR
ncbi:hypothetical protein [Microbacterium sp. bgisy189]|uniref:hypothetical protein n=1 Tax=Microbacterium sp. bgisy189 TaxID=3413798 RepID=UPI003EBCAE12